MRCHTPLTVLDTPKSFPCVLLRSLFSHSLTVQFLDRSRKKRREQRHKCDTSKTNNVLEFLRKFANLKWWARWKPNSFIPIALYYDIIFSHQLHILIIEQFHDDENLTICAQLFELNVLIIFILANSKVAREYECVTLTHLFDRWTYNSWYSR